MSSGRRWATQQEAEAKSKVVTDDLLAKHTRNNVFPELLIEKESVRYTFINMKPVWFDLEQLLIVFETEELRRRTKPGWFISTNSGSVG